MSKYEADVNIQITVTFDDDGEMSLKDQAWEAVFDHDFSPFDTDGEVVGEPRIVEEED